MINFASSQYKLLFGTHKCDCGIEHSFKVRCLLEHGAFNGMVSFISDFTPPLSRIALIYNCAEALMQEVYASLKRDFRVVCVRADCEKKHAEMLDLPEDTKLVLAIGADAVDCAKYKAYMQDLPVVYVGLPSGECLAPHSVMDEEGLKVAYAVGSPIGYIFDLDFAVSDEEKAALFGDVAAHLNTAFEYYCAALLSGSEYCPYIGGAMTDIAAKTIFTVSEMGRKAPNLSDVLIDAALRLAIISPSDLRGGDTQCSLTYDMLGESEARGGLRFVFAAVLSQLYRSHVMRRRSFTPPPDNNFRLEHIASLFGISEQRAIRGIRPQMTGREAALAEYKIREYTGELLEKLERNISLYKLAFKTFKRLHSDDGYSLTELIGGDVSLCIALAPDVVGGSGMLTTLKRLGELDAYIV